MSFFGKIKKGLGIGTAKVELTVPDRVEKESGELSGSLSITAKSEQKVKSVKIRLVETRTSGTGSEQKRREYILGEITPVSEPFDMAGDEQKEIQFSLPFSLNQSTAQSMADRGGALGALGKVAVKASNERSVFDVKAVVDLEGVALDPTSVRRVHLN
jgi:sporulation-control protein spo0M